MTKIRKILVPVDFSDESRRALKYARGFADLFGASIAVLHAWDLPGYIRPDLTVWAGDVSGTLAEHARRDAEDAMTRLLDEAGLAGREGVTSRVVSGTPYAMILAAIDEGDYDLVVMGTHGRTGLKHALLGSVAERVVRHSTRPVLTLRHSS